MNSVRIVRILNTVLITSFLLGCLGWLFLGAYYCFPNAEDLSLAASPRDIGTFKSMRNLMISYDGRYLTNLLHGLNPLTLNWLWAYKLIPVFGILFFASSFYFFLTTLFYFSQKNKPILISLLFIVVHFATAPSLPHDLYWMVSSFVYLYPSTFTFLWLGAYLQYIYTLDEVKSLSWFMASSIFLIFAIGLNEMFLVTNLGMLLLITYIAYRKDKLILTKTMPFVMVGIVSILFFITSPGIPIRAESNRLPGLGIFYKKGITQSIYDYKSATIIFFKNGLIFCASMLILLNTGSTRFMYKIAKKINHREKLGPVIIIAFLASYLMTLAYYMPMQVDIGYPSRIFNSSVVIQQVIFFIVIPIFFLESGIIQMISASEISRQAFIFILLTILLVLMFISNDNISELNKEFKSGIFKKYKNTMELRYEAISAVKLSDNCWVVAIVDSIKYPPPVIFNHPEIGKNRNPYYWNLAYEIYFGIDEIKLRGDTSQKLLF